MPYQVYSEDKSLFIAWTGDVSFDDLLEFNKLKWMLPGFDDHRVEIVDATGITSLTVDKLEAIVLAKINSIAYRPTPPVRVAFVTNQQFILDQAKTYRDNLNIDSLDIRFFDNSRDAVAWGQENA